MQREVCSFGKQQTPKNYISRSDRGLVDKFIGSLGIMPWLVLLPGRRRKVCVIESVEQDETYTALKECG